MATQLLIIQEKPPGFDFQLQSDNAQLEVLHRYPGEPLPDLASYRPDLVIIDLSDCSGSGHLIRQIGQAWPGCPILTLVDIHESAQASEAMALGAVDYLLKPFSEDQLMAAVEHALSLRKPIPNMVVASPTSQQVLLLAKKAAQTNASVLIGGESGTGKECLARFIHDQSPRADGPYVAVNCAAIPETMLEATLFGYNKGAFTGAQQGQTGKFELANGGSLLLDEVSEMSLGLQAKLLRVIQERELEKLGSNRKVPLDVRIIAASNRDLRKESREGRFREDLFYRLDVLPLKWPALRQRPEDIIPLARHFLNRHAPESGFDFHPDAIRALLAYEWPGNVRELENTIQRALILTRGLVIRLEDLMLPGGPAATLAADQPADVQTSRRYAEFQHVLETLKECKGQRKATAEALGVTTRALRYKLAAMREQGFDINQYAYR